MSSKVRNHRKSLRSIKFSRTEVDVLGDFFAAILFQQIVWISDNLHDGEEFPKFFEPCKHAEYKRGTSWFEFFGVSRYRFNKALGVIGQKTSKGCTLDPWALVYYWIGFDRIPMYKPNWPAIDALWEGTHPVFFSRNSKGLNYEGFVFQRVSYIYFKGFQIDNIYILKEKERERRARLFSSGEISKPKTKSLDPIEENYSLAKRTPVAECYKKIFDEVSSAGALLEETIEEGSRMLAVPSQLLDIAFLRLRQSNIDCALVLEKFLRKHAGNGTPPAKMRERFTGYSTTFIKLESQSSALPGVASPESMPFS